MVIKAALVAAVVLKCCMAISPDSFGTPSVVPLPLSAVQLHGDWRDAQERDQQVLMSLNTTQFACHFTSTANLTACAVGPAAWQTYTKDATGAFGPVQKGFLGQGSDVWPAANVSFSSCENRCLANSSCVGISFEAESATPTDPIHCYWKSTAHFTPLKTNCVAPGGVNQPRCSPLPGEMGLGGYYGHYQGHWLSATSFLISSTNNQTIRAKANEIIQIFSNVMDAWKTKYGVDGYLFPYDPLVFDKLLSGHGAGPYYSVPFYTLHKLMAGLLDQYVHAGSKLAFDLVKRMAGWVHASVEKCIATGGQDLWQRVLGTEWGGMNDVLYNLYSHTKDPVHLATGRRFNGWVFSQPLADGIDTLGSLPFPHANFHLPEVIGFARAYELTGNSTDSLIANNFFDELTANHSYSTGGSNSGECWQQPRDLGAFLTTQTEESCTQYNMLKVARRLFMQQADSKHADFYERAILNGIIGNQNRQEPGATSYIYMLPLGGAVKKQWGKSDYGFPCCWGTLSESFAKLGDSVYFASEDQSVLYVNQFVSSEVVLDGANIRVSQDAEAFRTHDNLTLTIEAINRVSSSSGTELTVAIRVPAWLSVAGSVSINGEPVAETITPGTYLMLHRLWNESDKISISFPQTLWTSPLNDYHPEYNGTLSFMYGPLVLAGVDMQSDIWVPKGTDFKTNPASFIVRNSSTELEFEATAADGSKLRMIPLREVMEEQYVVYFMTAGTKPVQPQNGYCPHSRGLNVDAHGHGVTWSVVDGMHMAM